MGSEQHAATRGIMQSIGGQWGTLFERRVALLHCTCNRVAPGFKDRGERGGGSSLALWEVSLDNFPARLTFEWYLLTEFLSACGT